MTERLADHLAAVFGRSGLVLHGSTKVKRRKSLVAEFQTHHELPFLVISLKAGGSGLNLTAASHVVHFDRWWDPAVENQATDGAFRTGQIKNVLVHKFVCRGTVEEKVCRGTVEEKIDRMIADKQESSNGLLDQGVEATLTKLKNDELMELVSSDLNRATTEA